MLTEHQIGLVKAIVRAAAEEVVVEQYANKIADLAAVNLKSNEDLFEIVGNFDSWGDAKEALKILKGEKKVCISGKSAGGRAVRTTSR